MPGSRQPADGGQARVKASILPEFLPLPPPQARAVPFQVVAQHGRERTDEYYWLRRREDPEVITHLEAENRYTQAVLESTAQLRETLYGELRSRILEEDSSVPYRDGEHWYYSRTQAGSEYPIYCRKEGTLEAPERILLDVNALAVDKGFTSVRSLEVSPDRQLLAYAVDHVGRRRYTIRIRDLRSGRDLPDVIPEVSGNMAWAADNRHLFYTEQDPQTLRSCRVRRHAVGGRGADALVYEEEDPQFSLAVFSSKSRRFLFLVSSQTIETEVRYLAADEPESDWRVFQPRRRGHEYFVDHVGERFWVRTNRAGRNFGLCSVHEAGVAAGEWLDEVPARDDVLLSGFELFEDLVVLDERHQALGHLRVRSSDGAVDYRIDFEDPACSVTLGPNPDPRSPHLRFVYESMVTPPTTYDYEFATRRRLLLRRRPVPHYEPSRYETSREWVTAGDGASIPVSLAFRRDLRRDGKAPLLLYAYGAYGISTEPVFRSAIFSLIDRGFVFALAHVRGGSELGRPWYEAGRLRRKWNTFHDFIAVAEALVDRRFTASDRLFARGGSAGGQLMGVVANERPELFRGILAGVPFVDVVTTMLDDSIPLTTFEYDEWGNPNEKDDYDYMLSYSPYDNVRPQAYPGILATAGLHDSQVQYWEPAKWVARLREANTGPNVILLNTNMEAGHGGASGRFESLREAALEYSFLLTLLG